MRIIFTGNQKIGHACLKHLIESNAHIVAVYAIPEGYWKKISGSSHGTDWFVSVGKLAEQHSIPTYYPEDINTPETVQQIKDLRPDVLFSVSWDQMIGEDILAVPPQGCINMHDSLLPKYRGHAPINWAIINGENETAYTMHYMVKKADAGDIISQKKVPIYFEDRAIDVYNRVVDAGIVMFKEMLPLIKQGNAPRIKQDIGKGCYGKRRKPEDGLIDWHKSAVELYNWIRALTKPYPGAFTFFKGQKLMIWKAVPYEGHSYHNKPGWLFDLVQDKGVIVNTGSGCLLIEELQEVTSKTAVNAYEYFKVYSKTKTDLKNLRFE